LIILKEIAIEANFTMNFAFLKFKDKALLNPERKRNQIVKEFVNVVVEQYIRKAELSSEQFFEILKGKMALKTQYDCIIKQFDRFNERNPEPLEVFISKFNA
jgi:hypothetical protein